MTNIALNKTGTIIKTNKSGGAHVQGDVCVESGSDANAVINDTAGAFVDGLVYVCLEPNGVANNASGQYAFGGYVPKINLSASASLRSFVKTHTVAKQGVSHAAPMIAGDFAMVLGTGTSPAAILFPVKPSGLGGGTVNDLIPVPQISKANDTFSDTNGTNLNAHTMDLGPGWTTIAGSITIQSNQAVCQNGTNDYQFDCGFNDVKIVADFKCGEATANCAPTIVLRGTSNTRRLLIYLSGDGNGSIYNQNAGSFTPLATFTWTADTNLHTATVVAVGTTITLQIDSGMVWTFANIRQQAGGTLCGIRGFVNGGNKDAFDNFQVYADETESAFPDPFVTNILTDAFTHSDTTRLNTFGWTEEAGQWQVDTNQAKQTLTSAPTNGYVVDRDEALSDLAIEVTITTPSSGGSICGIVLRGQDKNNYIEVELNTTNAPAKGFALWYTNNSGTFTEIASTEFTPATNTTYTLRIQAKGNYIIAYLVEANLRISGFCDMFLTATNVGLFEARDGSRINPNFYDSYKVYGV